MLTSPGGAYGQRIFVKIQYGGPWCSVQSSDFSVEYLIRYTILTQQGSIKVVVTSSQMMTVFEMGIIFARVFESGKSGLIRFKCFALYQGELVLPRSLKVFYENNMDIEKFPIRKFLNHTCYFELFNGE